MKKLVFLPLLLATSYLLLATPAFAVLPGGGTGGTLENPVYNDPTGGFVPNATQYQSALSESGANLEKFTLGQLNSTVQGLTKLVTGYPTLPGEQANGGAIGGLGTLIAGMYTNTPISSREYLAYVGQNTGLISSAYAANKPGFTLLSPVLPLWTLMRNISYLAFIVIFVIIGLTVMLRKKIDPRTVASVQEALPRIVIALILVTFSYALVGLMVDLSQVSIWLIANILSPTFRDPVAPSINDFLERFTKADDLNIFNVTIPIISTADLSNKLIAPLQTQLDKLSPINVPLLGNIVGTIAGLVVGIAVITSLFKIFFSLLFAYVNIVLSAIFSPFQFLLSALPGNSGAIGNWFRNILANIMIFPVTFLMLFLAAIFSGPEKTWSIAQNLPPLEWFPAPLGVLGNDASFVWKLLAVGIILITPKAGDMIKEAIQVKSSPWGASAGQELRGAAGHIPIIGGYLR